MSKYWRNVFLRIDAILVERTLTSENLRGGAMHINS